MASPANIFVKQLGLCLQMPRQNKAERRRQAALDAEFDSDDDGLFKTLRYKQQAGRGGRRKKTTFIARPEARSSTPPNSSSQVERIAETASDQTEPAAQSPAALADGVPADLAGLSLQGTDTGAVLCGMPHIWPALHATLHVRWYSTHQPWRRAENFLQSHL